MKTLFFIFLLLSTVLARLYINTNSYGTVYGRVDGWKTKEKIISKRIDTYDNLKDLNMEDMIVMYDFNPLDISYEDMVNKFSKYKVAALIVKALSISNPPGDAFYKTDSSGTYGYNLPLAEIDQTSYAEIIKLINSTTFANLTFTENNQYIDFDNRFDWSFFVSIHILWQLYKIIHTLIKLYQYDFFSTDFVNNIKKENYKFVYSCLILCLISSILKFFNAININDINLLYDFKASRILYTLHLLPFILELMSLGLWAYLTVKKVKSMKFGSTLFNRKAITGYIISGIILILIEINNIIGTYYYAKNLIWWGSIVIGIYSLYDLIMIIIYTRSNVIILQQLNNQNKSASMKDKIKHMIIKIFFTVFGMVVWLIMLLLNFMKLSFAVKRYVGLFGFYGINISETALILTFDRDLKNGVKSSTTTTKAKLSTVRTDTISSSSTDLPKEFMQSL